MDRLQAERNALLRYALQNPPKNVDIVLPRHVRSIDELDLSLCPSPIPLYTEAMKKQKGASEGKVIKSKRSLFATSSPQPKHAKHYTLDLSFMANPGSRVITRFAEGGNGSTANSSPGALVVQDVPGTKTTTTPQLTLHTNTTAAHPGATPAPRGGLDGQTAAETSGQGVAVNLTTRLLPAEGDDAGPVTTMRDHHSGSNPRGTPPLLSNTISNVTSPARGASYPSPSTSTTTPQHGRTRSGNGGEAGVLSQMVHYFLNRLNNEPRLNAPKGLGATLRKDANRRGHGGSAAASLVSAERYADPAASASAMAAASRNSAGGTSTSVGGGGGGSLSQPRGLLPLHGNTRGTLADCIPTIASMAPWPEATLGECPVPYIAEISPIFDSDVLNVFTEDFGLIIYEHILIASQLLFCDNRTALEEEVYNVYGMVFKISAEQHLRCLTNLMPPSLRTAVTSGELASATAPRQQLEFHFDDVTLRELVANSHDEGFVARMTALLHAIDAYPDGDEEDGGGGGGGAGSSRGQHLRHTRALAPTRQTTTTELDDEGNLVVRTVNASATTNNMVGSDNNNTGSNNVSSSQSGRPRGRPYPFAIRATLLAGALRPMYAYDDHGKLAFSEGHIRHCLAALLKELALPQEILSYCHLHARLMANNEEVAKETLHSWLRDATRAVNELSDEPLARRPLTPAVKYACYVLQETLGVATAPMPWLHSFFGTDSLSNLSAFFIESCLALPPNCLAVFFRIDGSHIAPSTTSSGTYVFALLSIFLGISTIRHFDKLLTTLRQALLPSATVLAGADTTRWQLCEAQQLSRVLRRCITLDQHQRQYCTLLTRSLPSAAGLVLPARMRMGAYVVMLHWGLTVDSVPTSASGGRSDDATASPLTASRTSAEEQRRGGLVAARLEALSPLPADFAGSVSVLLAFLLDALDPPETWRLGDETHAATTPSSSAASTSGRAKRQTMSATAAVPPSRAVTDDQEMMRVLSIAAGVHLRGVGRLVQRHDAMLLPMVQNAVRRTWTWAVTETQCTEPHAPLMALLRRCTRGTGADGLPPPLGADPAALYVARLGTFVEATRLVLDRIRVDNPPSAANRDTPLIYAQHRRLVEFYKQVTAAPVTRADVLGLLHRLNTLSAVQDECESFFSNSLVQYEQVRRVTGAPQVQVAEYWQTVCNCARQVKNELCERLSATLVLSPPLYVMMTEQYMRTDAAAVQGMKGGGPKSFVAHYPRAFPAVTIDTVLAELRKVFADVPLVARPHFRDEVYCSIGVFFVALLYGVYVEGGDVLLTVYDAEVILEDLNKVRTFCVDVLHGAMTQSSASTAVLSCVTTAFTGGANGGHGASGSSSAWHASTLSSTFDEDMRNCFGGDIRTVPGAEHALRLCQVSRELRNIVRYVMTQESAVLIAGGDGVPPMASLPEFKGNSPWCKYIVRQVLEHRRDKTARQVSG